MDWVDAAPHVDVQESEYVRLLGYPRGHQLDGRARELADEARAWFGAHGAPWISARFVQPLTADGDGVRLAGERFASARLSRAVTGGGAHAAFVVAVSAGPEVTDSALDAWQRDRPDDYFFLEMYGSAVVEHLVTVAGARLCAWADAQGLTVLPHDSPGYTGWDVAEQPRLFSVMAAGERPGPFEVMESGMLRPKKSLLAVFAVSRDHARAAARSDLVPCSTCAFGPCQYRRAPYRHADGPATKTAHMGAVDAAPVPNYVTPIKALRRWASERLTVSPRPDGRIEVTFRYDGTTCSQLGQPLAFLYSVTVGPRELGFPIERQTCAPVAGDHGHRAMCQYLREGDTLIDAVAADAPLAGQSLHRILGWNRPLMGPGCYCDATARAHKWGLVLETIHYALVREEGRHHP